MNWKTMDSAPKDGSSIIVRYPLQGNVKRIAHYNTIHNFWASNGEPFWPEKQECEWFQMPSDAAPSVASAAPTDAETHLQMIEAITNDFEQSINFVQVSEEELQYASAGDAHQAQAVQELKGAVAGIRAALASVQKTVLTDEQIHNIWRKLCAGGKSFGNGVGVIHIARAIEAASGPNLALVEALQRAYQYLSGRAKITKQVTEFQACSSVTDKISAALAAAGVGEK